MKGPIIALEKEVLIDRRDERLKQAWVRRPQEVPRWRGGTWVTPTVELRRGDDPILLFLGKAESLHEALFDAINAAREDNHIYVILEDGMEDLLIFLESTRALIRKVPVLHVTGVYDGSAAQVAIGHNLFMRLDEGQSASLRQHFLRSFWHEATEEAWHDGDDFVWRKVGGERPFDIPRLSPKGDLSWADQQTKPDSNWEYIHRADEVLPEEPARRLWINPGPQHHTELARHVEQGSSVVWDDHGLPEVGLKRDCGELVLGPTSLRFRLNEGQTHDLKTLLNSQTPWEFLTDVRLGDFADTDSQFWLSGEKSAEELIPRRSVTLPHETALTLDTMNETPPREIPISHPLALEFQYTWTVQPPRLPKGSKEDDLVLDWGKIDRDWKNRLAKLETTLKENQDKRGRLRERFTSLVREMLGFDHSHKALQDEANRLEQLVPSMGGPREALDWFRSLGELEQKVSELAANVAEAETKAKEEEERENQRQAFEAARKEAQEGLPKSRERLKQIEESQEQRERDLELIEEELRSADKKTRRDLGAKKKKLTDEKERDSKQIKSLQSQIAALKAKSEEEFIFKPQSSTMNTKRTSGGFVPQESTKKEDPQLPQDALPQVGVLRSHKGRRFLVIENWEEHALGKTEAARLSAELLAPEGT